MQEPSAERLSAREALLLELTQIPTAAGHERRVVAFIDGWLAARSRDLEVARDGVGNILVMQRRRDPSARPLLATAHLDHPAFVVDEVTGSGFVAAFRGGVNDPYFVGAEIEVIGPRDERATARIASLDAAATPFKRVAAELDAPAAWLAPGCIARWSFPRAEIADGLLHTDACDDLAAAAAALCALDEAMGRPGCGHFGLLFTVAEEVGFLGTIHAARNGWVPRDARLVCLENSRSFPSDSPIGAGAILRVGDRISVFTPALTNHLAHLFSAEGKRDPSFRWQRKLMPGGGCEASAFACYGYESTCICLPLGNYHNMCDIDGVAAGTAPARVGREFVSVGDFHSMVRMLLIAAEAIDRPLPETTEQLMERLYAERAAAVLGGPRVPAGT